MTFTGPSLHRLPASRSGAHGDVLQNNGGQLSLAEDLLGVEDLDSHEGFAGADVQGDLLVQPHGAALLGAFDQADVKGVDFVVIADPHNGLASEVEGVNGNHHDFGGLLFDDGGYLL